MSPVRSVTNVPGLDQRILLTGFGDLIADAPHLLSERRASALSHRTTGPIVSES
jgi:hypothetical protein